MLTMKFPFGDGLEGISFFFYFFMGDFPGYIFHKGGVSVFDIELAWLLLPCWVCAGKFF